MNAIRNAALAFAAAGSLGAALPASAAIVSHAPVTASTTLDIGASDWNHRRHGRDRSYERYGHRDSYYGEPVRRDTRVWRGRDGRYYCRRDNGTTGLLIGGVVGGLAGHEIAGRGDRTLGAILGAAGGALLGREIDRSNSRCR